MGRPRRLRVISQSPPGAAIVARTAPHEDPASGLDRRETRLVDLLTVLPIAIVMIAGPQIISAILLATSVNARANSYAFVAGVTLAVTIGVTIAYFVAKQFHESTSSSSDTGLTPLDYVIVGLLLVGMVLVFRGRKKAEPPKWMGKLQGATPKYAFRLGVLLFLLMPTDIIGMITVGSYLARHGDQWWGCLPFVLLTVLFVGTPLLILLLLGKRADTILPRMRDWMNKNSWIISEVVLIFFIVITLLG